MSPRSLGRSRSVRFTRLAAVTAILVIAACTDPAAPAQSFATATNQAIVPGEYTVIELGTLNGGNSEAADINDHGVIVGWSGDQGDAQDAFVWQNGTMTALPSLGGIVSAAWGVNNAGQIVGHSTTSSSAIRPVVWSDGAVSELPLPFGSTGGLATEINDAGMIVGAAFGPSGWSALTWTAGSVTVLPSPAGGSGFPGGNYATAVNSAGDVVGWSTVAGQQRAVIWKNGVATDLGTLGGSTSRATDVNDAGQVIGYASESFVEQTPFLWQNGVMTELASPGPGFATNFIQPFGINESGQIVGWGTTTTFEDRPMYWSPGAVTTLPLREDCAWAGANRINELGHVVGMSCDRATLWRVLTPVERLSQLLVSVDALVSRGVLQHGLAGSLTRKLHVATALLNDGKIAPALNLLAAFIQEAESLMDGGRLPAADGQLLVDAARSAISALSA